MVLRVSLAFAKLPDAELENFAQGVTSAMTGNAAYPTPPVTMANLQTARTDFAAKIAATQLGGPRETAAKNDARQSLLALLRPLAGYVQITANNDMAKLLSSGFQAMSTNRAQTPLERPDGLRLQHAQNVALAASVDPVKNASMYEGRIKGPTGDWLPPVFSGDSQHIIFAGLTPGTVYTIQVRALGGLTGQSDWSNPSSLMAV
jgi:hypothetical protein